MPDEYRLALDEFIANLPAVGQASNLTIQN
jgi:hypothetical protein